MIWKMRIGALAAFSALVLVASVAAPASADFHSEVQHTTWVGAQTEGVNDVYTYNVGTWVCNVITYSGTTSSATSSTLALTPTFSGCTAFGFVNAVQHVNGCQYQLHSQNGTMDILCPEGKSMVITAFNCHVKVPAQTGVTGVSYTNQGSGANRDISLNFNVSGLKYTQESKSFPGCTNGTFANGTFKGSATVKGSSTVGVQAGVWQTPGGSEPVAEYHSEAAHTLWSASQVGEDVHTFEGGTWKCTSKTYTGTGAAATGTTIGLAPSFSGCTNGTTVDTNGCELQYHTQKKGSTSLGMGIACPAGKSIVITAPNCHVTIPAQSGLTGVTYANESTGYGDVKISHTTTGLKYTQESKAFPGCSNGPFANGTYSGTTTLKGTNTAGEQIGVAIDKQPEPPDEFKVEGAHTLLTASQIGEDTYTFTAGTWKCASATQAGTTTTAASTTVNLAPTFGSCTSGTTVDVNGCEYRFHTKKAGVSSQEMSIACPAGKSIVITDSHCDLAITTQSGLTGVAYVSEGSGKTRDVKISYTITGIKYSQTGKEFPACTGGSFANGTYSGSMTLKGLNTAGEQVGVWVD